MLEFPIGEWQYLCMTHRGRPRLFTGSGHAINVMLPIEDFDSLRRHVDRLKRERPGFGFADLVRAYIREGLDRDHIRRAPADPGTERERHLRLIARTALKLLREARKPQAA